MNNLKELRGKSKEELDKMLKAQREAVRDLRFKDSNKQLKNVRDLRVAKKEVAKILTVLNENNDNKDGK
ncbi:50S ribosomal protein L29 [Patescibacteria group bacterium]|nr:50S ribosomal protein L29 [Patescibacteria group bacterium]MBU1673652.1 50S ribosomal protein L29 [Patescibacteria group bacterium]MBU1963860.1 50S ribosomal protein L29 [Patescibacteria group bacterium]